MPTILPVARAVRRTVGPLGLMESSGGRPPSGPSTLAGGMAGPLGRSAARSGRAVSNRLQTPGRAAQRAVQRAPREPVTGPTGRPFPQPSPSGWETPRPPKRFPAQRANHSPRRPYGSSNGRPVGPDGMLWDRHTSRAFDPGWGNGWPVGPVAGPFGPGNFETPANPGRAAQRAVQRAAPGTCEVAETPSQADLDAILNNPGRVE
jgi:hypothetical protein